MAHKVPQGSSNCKIELVVENTSSAITRHVRVVAPTPPSWLKFENQTVTIDHIEPGTEAVATFTFSVDQTVPLGKEEKLMFMIRSEHGEKWKKEISIMIVKPSVFVKLANKLKAMTQQPMLLIAMISLAFSHVPAQPLTHTDSLFYKELFPALGGKIMAATNTYLGIISPDTSNPESIMNQVGGYGSDNSSTSIFNILSPFGGMDGSLSPFNPHSASPPKIFRDTVLIGYLTENEGLSPRIPTYRIVGFLTDLAKRRLK